jgi:phenylacetate-coenzyme A ligase PaaK-like adenylate-forming protein
VVSDVLLRLYHRLPAPARTAAATLRGFYLRAWRYGADFERLVDAAHLRERWTPAQWNAWRDERLAALLERAATRVPYYREAWRARRRAGDRASWELLENWPILEKQTLREHPGAFLADDAGRDLLREHTSGTSGLPLSIGKNRATLRGLYALAAARGRRWYGVLPGDRTARLGGQLVVPFAQRRPPFWVWNAAGRELYMSTFHLAPELVTHYLDALVRYRVVCLTGYTSSLVALAHEVLRAGRVDLRMKVVVTSAEPLGEDQRQAIGAAFGCPVRETYGMTENVAAASECEAGRLHQWPEVGVIEALDEEFICTSLINDAMPLIRYRLGDRGRLAPPGDTCPCGRTLPLIAAIEGRTSDLLVTADGRRIFWMNPVLYGLPVRQGQIVQESVRHIRVRFIPAPAFSEAAGRTIVSRIRDRLGDVEVALEPVADLPRTSAGKVRAIVADLARSGA